MKNKMNSVIAKALAQKVRGELINIKSELRDKVKKDLDKKIVNDPLVLQYNDLVEELNQLNSKIVKKYKNTCFNNYSGNNKEKFEYYVSDKDFDIPSEEQMKNDILLASWAETDFNAEQIIEKLVAKYKQKWKI